MTNLRTADPAPADLDGDLASLRGDCARMSPRWSAPAHVSARPVPVSLLHGVRVPQTSARLLEAMSDYGD
ncbi:hypothetical protein LZP81_26520 [Streptomyces parvulus]|uniref:Uncharacterized protein n=1 Tax=Streptomyces parvulus TaxID=146923 RepID=A0A191UWJ0_9ACTN|nr:MULTISPECIES: hypothetical protein [Streptomyces]ANJ07111.1 hypothetical protein Spa2297_08905 [Streptomyces parvulus]MCC9152632.1 hypothetical protein [Streptomyces parvulus]MCE7690417.1 hypothetical protein [Streptomyces parvulus]MCQ4196614.1 hypothetical protein [Streptomyces parvulus]MZD53146.1 hypothetical protein [Streptomyces sp. SID5606]